MAQRVVGLGVGASENELIEALVRLDALRIVVRADAELEVSLMISSQLDANFDRRVHLVRPNDHPLAVLAASFVGTRLQRESKKVSRHFRKEPLST